MKSKPHRGRLALIYIVMVLSFGLLAGRLFEIQVLRGEEYGKIARAQSTGKTEIPARRGIIYDRTGRELAINIATNSLYAYPRNKNEIRKMNSYLDRIFGWKPGTASRRYKFRTDHFSWIKRNISDDLAAKIATDDINGLFLYPEVGRDYPFGNIGKQILGCTDIDGKGLSGIEYGSDSILAGSPGVVDYLRDGKRNTYRLRETPLIEPQPGNSMVLTVDWYFQEIVEEELRKAVEKYKAKSGTAFFLNCNSGEILAAADYDPSSESFTRLGAVSDCFEPGSVLKIVAAAALLDEDLVELDEKIYCEHGFWKCGRGRLRDDKELDTLIFKEIMALSSNIGIGKLAQRLGGEKLRDTYAKFGFGQKFFIDFPGEADGSIGNPGVWSEYNIAALSIGHAISATPLQIASAMASVANGGNLYRPRLIGGVINAEGKVIHKSDEELLGRMMEKKSSEILRGFLELAVDSGTATPVRSEIIKIAGKTGTAQIPNPEKGGYFWGKFNASFAGYFPADKPLVAGVVVLTQPEPVHYGGHTAGPAFKTIAERYVLAHCDHLRPNTRLIADTDHPSLREIPDFIGRDFSLAVKMAENKDLILGSNGDRGMVIWQYPPAHREVPGKTKVAILVSDEADSDLKMADLVGMNLRTALSVLHYQGVRFDVVGSGRVKRQFPEPGTSIGKTSQCRLVCGNG